MEKMWKCCKDLCKSFLTAYFLMILAFAIFAYSFGGKALSSYIISIPLQFLFTFILIVSIFSTVITIYFNYKYSKDKLDIQHASSSITILSYSGRIINTFLSLEVIFFFFNFAIQSILLFPPLLYDIENIFLKIIFYPLFFLYLIFSPIILVIPIYEFISFPYLYYKEPFLHLQTFKFINSNIDYNDYDEEKYDKVNKVENIIYSIEGIYFCILFLSGFKSELCSLLKDNMEFYIIFLNFINYITLIFCYLFFSIKFNIVPYFVRLVNFLKKKMFFSSKIKFSQLKNSEIETGTKTDVTDNNEIKNIGDNKEEEEKEELKNKKEEEEKKDKKIINILSYIMINQKNNNQDCKYDKLDLFITILKIVMIFFAIIGFIYLYINNNFTFPFFIIYMCILLLSIGLNFSIRYFLCCKEETKLKYNSSKINLSLYFSFSISILLIVALILINIKIDEKEDNHAFENAFLKREYNILRNKSYAFHNFCHSKLYNLSTYLYQPFINDAYYYDKKKNYSSFHSDNYTKLFFDDKYDVKVIGNLVNESKVRSVRMIQYFIKNKKNNNNVTILSIKGTSYKRDAYLDAQLYLPSVLLNILNTFSNLDHQKEALTFNLTEYALSIPYRLFFQYSLIEEYLDKLKNAYLAAVNNSMINDNDNIVLVGHSLGGGLAKILGKILGKQAISLSGPGINAFHSLWDSKGNSRFELTSIDIVPDSDIVPRVEVSSGTIYRLICVLSPLECHSKELSLCESLIICKNPYAKEYCRNIAKIEEEDINKTEILSEFNK